ncbi:MAG: amidohydrolase family protein [Blastocatellia bacterium]
MNIIDTHQHLWDQDLLSYSWTAKVPLFNRSFRIDDYLAATAGLNVIKSVHVEADVDEKDMVGETRYICALAERDDNPLSGVVAGARPESTDFPDYLKQIQHPSLRGVRRILHVVPDEVSYAPCFLDNLRLLEQYNLSFDICVLERQLPIAIRLVRECPNVQFILDHCGNPLVKEGVFEPWRSLMHEIAAYPNVVCKISGIVVNAGHENWTTAQLRPYVRGVIECFGWDRVMFGSDWPVCTQAAALRRWAETLIDLSQDASADNQRKLFQLNAERIYRI